MTAVVVVLITSTLIYFATIMSRPSCACCGREIKLGAKYCENCEGR